METKEPPIEIDPSILSHDASTYVLGVSASKNVPPQKAIASIIEVIARNAKDVRKTLILPTTPTPDPKRAA